MKKSCPALLLVYAVIFIGCPQASAATIGCGQTVTGCIVSPAQKNSYTFTANGGEAIIVTAVKTSGTLSTFAVLFDPSGARIAARGKLYVTDQKFFVDSGDSLVQGYVKITRSGPRLAGSVAFGDPERKRFSSSLPLVSNLLTSAIFGQVASNSTYSTGIAILNPNEADATATIDVLDRNGNLVRTRTESIGAKRRVSKLVTQNLEYLVGQDIASGYIKVIADIGVAFALFGTNDLSVLSAIPPQVVP